MFVRTFYRCLLQVVGSALQLCARIQLLSLKCRLASSNWLDACLGTESSSQSAPLLQNACVSLYRRAVSYSAVCGASIERKKRTLRLMLALA